MRFSICDYWVFRGKKNTGADVNSRRANEDSILAVQIFDQKKFKKKDQGFLGVINVRIGDIIDFSSPQEG
jgi:hypothetical protein